MSNISQEKFFSGLVAQETKEKRYVLGPYASYTIKTDPKHLFFALARYKFCSKILDGRDYVLEIGCGDGLGIELMLQSCGRIKGLDITAEIVDYAREHNPHPDRVEYEQRNIITDLLPQLFDAAYSLDVIEHIEPELENVFIRNIARSLKDNAPLIIGTPNVTASAYASEASRAAHINLKNHNTLRDLLEKYFHNVFIFAMNDEVIHTGFYPMAHYLVALAVGPKQ
jgi:2-polyprenyl-3-methyl-5-hydroxy-6-metoxy-1,4-benzoquinol methylase